MGTYEASVEECEYENGMNGQFDCVWLSSSSTSLRRRYNTAVKHTLLLMHSYLSACERWGMHYSPWRRFTSVRQRAKWREKMLTKRCHIFRCALWIEARNERHMEAITIQDGSKGEHGSDNPYPAYLSFPCGACCKSLAVHVAFSHWNAKRSQVM